MSLIQTYAPTIPTRQSAFSITGNGSGLPASRTYNDYNRPTEDNRLQQQQQQQQLRQPSFNQSINSSGLQQPSRNQVPSVTNIRLTVAGG